LVGFLHAFIAVAVQEPGGFGPQHERLVTDPPKLLERELVPVCLQASISELVQWPGGWCPQHFVSSKFNNIFYCCVAKLTNILDYRSF
jgi:hypothetical protein